MTKCLFFDVDTQNDFMNSDGALYVPGAEDIKSNLKLLIDYARQSECYILGSVDAHSIDDPEFKWYGPHCISGTAGQLKITETQIDDAFLIPLDFEGEIPNDVKHFVIEKQEVDVFTNKYTEKLLEQINPENIILFGVASDVCVRAAFIGLIKKYKSVALVTDAMKAIDNKRAADFFEEASRLGVKMVKTHELLKGRVCVLH